MHTYVDHNLEQSFQGEHLAIHSHFDRRLSAGKQDARRHIPHVFAQIQRECLSDVSQNALFAGRISKASSSSNNNKTGLLECRANAGQRLERLHLLDERKSRRKSNSYLRHKHVRATLYFYLFF